MQRSLSQTGKLCKLDIRFWVHSTYLQYYHIAYLWLRKLVWCICIKVPLCLCAGGVGVVLIVHLRPVVPCSACINMIALLFWPNRDSVFSGSGTRESTCRKNCCLEGKHCLCRHTSLITILHFIYVTCNHDLMSQKESEKRQVLERKGHGEYRDVSIQYPVWYSKHMAAALVSLCKPSVMTELNQVAEGDFLAEVTGSEKVVCHFYHHEFVRCK